MCHTSSSTAVDRQPSAPAATASTMPAHAFCCGQGRALYTRMLESTKNFTRIRPPTISGPVEELLALLVDDPVDLLRRQVATPRHGRHGCDGLRCSQSRLTADCAE